MSYSEDSISPSFRSHYASHAHYPQALAALPIAVQSHSSEEPAPEELAAIATVFVQRLIHAQFAVDATPPSYPGALLH